MAVVPDEKKFQYRTWEDVPTGLLRLTIDWSFSWGTKTVWEESKTNPLESQVQDIFLTILNAGPRHKAASAMSDAREAIRRAAEERRREAIRRAEEEKRLDDALAEDASRWERALQVRRLAEHVRTVSLPEFPALSAAGRDAWLARADRVAAQLDPTDAILGRFKNAKDDDGESAEDDDGDGNDYL